MNKKSYYLKFGIVMALAFIVNLISKFASKRIFFWYGRDWQFWTCIGLTILISIFLAIYLILMLVKFNKQYVRSKDN